MINVVDVARNAVEALCHEGMLMMSLQKYSKAAAKTKVKPECNHSKRDLWR